MIYTVAKHRDAKLIGVLWVFIPEDTNLQQVLVHTGVMVNWVKVEIKVQFSLCTVPDVLSETFKAYFYPPT